MSARKKPSNSKHLRLKRKLDKLVSVQRKIDLLLDNTLLDLKRLTRMIDKIKPDYSKR